MELFDGLELTENWAYSTLKSMNWAKRKGAIWNVESSKKFLEKEKFTSQRKICSVILDHDIPAALVPNLDQKPLFYISLGKYSFSLKGSKYVSFKGLNDKLQITATFVVTTTGPLQLIYQGKQKFSSKFTYSSDFHVTFRAHHWLNLEKCLDIFNAIIFPYLSAKKKKLDYPGVQCSLIILNILKYQDNDEMRWLSK